VSFRARVALKAAVWIGSLWPLGVLVRGFLRDDLGANPIEYVTRTLGLTALVLLLTSLGMTPLLALCGWSWPIQLRRLLGLFAFFYVCLHFSVWIVLDHFFAWRRMWEDVLKRPFITVGMLALLLLIPLALTSTQGMIKRLGGARWRLLHKLVYVIGALGVLHFLWLAKKGRPTPFYYALALALLLGVRAWEWLRKRARLTQADQKGPDARRRPVVRVEGRPPADTRRGLG
jgi:methionine sulfoxide reductase heme-binding subunit